jgi:hypothetical protein
MVRLAGESEHSAACVMNQNDLVLSNRNGCGQCIIDFSVGSYDG